MQLQFNKFVLFCLFFICCHVVEDSYQFCFILIDAGVTCVYSTQAYILRMKSSFSPLSKEDRLWYFFSFADARLEVLNFIALKCSRTGGRLNSPDDSRDISWHLASHRNVLLSLNRQPFTAEGNEMWLAASADRRVSVWAADWLDDKCSLLDWLTFPAPACPEVRCFNYQRKSVGLVYVLF